MTKLNKTNQKTNISAVKVAKTGRNQLTVPSFSFRVRPTNATPSQVVAIYLLINYLGKKTEVKTPFECRKSEFTNNPATISRVSLNKLFQDYIHCLYDYAFELKRTKANYSVYDLKEAVINGGVVVFVPTVLHLIEQYLSLKRAECHNGDLSIATLNKIRGWNNKVLSYFTQKYGQEANIEQVVAADAKQFHAWLKANYPLSHNIANKILQHCKTLLNYAVELDYLSKNPFFNLHLRYETKRTEYLSQEEIKVIELTHIEHSELAVHKDIFLFCCYTGLAYTDVKGLRRENIVILSNSVVYINKTRNKTNQRQTIPLIPKALNLLLKYENNPFCIKNDVCFPVTSNQKTNSYLKQLGVICNISKPISSHLARKTCATWLKANNVPTTIITEWMGHSSIKTTEKYYFGYEPERMVTQALRILNKN